MPLALESGCCGHQPIPTRLPLALHSQTSAGLHRPSSWPSLIHRPQLGGKGGLERGSPWKQPSGSCLEGEGKLWGSQTSYAWREECSAAAQGFTTST